MTSSETRMRPWMTRRGPLAWLLALLAYLFMAVARVDAVGAQMPPLAGLGIEHAAYHVNGEARRANPELEQLAVIFQERAGCAAILRRLRVARVADSLRQDSQGEQAIGSMVVVRRRLPGSQRFH